jgi:hypothetical protein
MFWSQVAVWSGPFTSGPWTNYQTVGTGTAPFTLTAGEHTLTVCIDAGDANIDKIL